MGRRSVGGLVLAMLVLAGCDGSSGTSSQSSPAQGVSPPATSPAPPPNPAPSPTTGAATLSWTAPTTNSDGSALTNLAGYNIRYGTSPGSLSQSVQVAGAATATYTITGLASGTWYFEISDYTNTGVASAFTGTVSKIIS